MKDSVLIEIGVELASAGLWALTFSTFIILFLTIIKEATTRSIRAHAPKTGERAIIFFLLAIVSPFLGLFAAMVIWVVAIAVLYRSHQRLCLAASAVLVIWGWLPLIVDFTRENVEDFGYRAALDYQASIGFSPEQVVAVKTQSTLNRDDAVLVYAMHRIARDEGNIPFAEAFLDRLSRLTSNQGFVTAARGALLLSQGKHEEAQRSFQLAESAGFRTAELLFLRSLAAARLTQIDISEQYIAEARKLNLSAVSEWVKREVGAEKNRLATDIAVPLTILVPEVIKPKLSAVQRNVPALIPVLPASPPVVASFGLALFIVTFLFRNLSRYERVTYSATLRKLLAYLPGGHYIVKERDVKAILVMALAFLPVVVLIGYPVGQGGTLKTGGFQMDSTIAFTAGVFVTLWFVGLAIATGAKFESSGS